MDTTPNIRRRHCTNITGKLSLSRLICGTPEQIIHGDKIPDGAAKIEETRQRERFKKRAASRDWHYRRQRAVFDERSDEDARSSREDAVRRCRRMRLCWALLEGKRVAFLARHGRGHRILPGEINYRANIYAMKLLGVERIISVSAVGSLKEDLRPGEFLVPDQFVDRTKNRVSTFFGDGLVAHVALRATRPAGRCPGYWPTPACIARVKVHRRGTYVCIEGPQFSTLAEANVHRQLRFEVIGMTNVTEAKLAREAEICYATIAMITDFDCWHPEHESVTASQIIATLSAECGERAKACCAKRCVRCPRNGVANAARRCSMRWLRI